MKTLREFECEMVSAQVSANRYMREATAHIEDRYLWELWQQAEEVWLAARQRWLEAKEVAEHAA